MSLQQSAVPEVLNFRPKATQQVARWIASAQCGQLIGLSGSGRSRLLADLVQRPELLRPHLPKEIEHFVPLSLDVKNMHSAELFWQHFLRTLYESRERLCSKTQKSVITCYLSNQKEDNPFKLEAASRDLLQGLSRHSTRIAIVFDRLDQFYRSGNAIVADALFDLQTTFSGMLSLIAGTQREVRPPADKQMLESLFAGQRVWLGSVAEHRARPYMLSAHFDSFRSYIDLHDELLRLAGGFPTLLTAFADWCRSTRWEWVKDAWQDDLYRYHLVQNELQQLWDGLTHEERTVLSDMELIKPKQYAKFEQRNGMHLRRFGRAGLCIHKGGRWHIFSELFARFIRDSRHTVRGNIWFNERDDTYYQGPLPLDDLSPRAEAALAYFLNHPYKKCEKDQLIAHIWETPFVTDDSVYQVIRELRRTIEPDTRNPCYIINHRSLRGGRYQFFPEGRPKNRALT